MEDFFRAAALALLTVILCLTISGQARATAAVLVMGAGALVLILGLGYLRSVLDFLEELQTLAGLNGQMVLILLKCCGISLVGEITGLICADSGNGSLGKALQILGCCVILWLSLPVFQELIKLIRKILEAV